MLKGHIVQSLPYKNSYKLESLYMTEKALNYNGLGLFIALYNLISVSII
ncbi:hypothetical protein DJ41_1703 [Acinetobacter baumannii ATCC 19606 = CIP 70.34 = JCM 6841]|nr:hypothetical protein DJ41_1703 [Acinetobacter baumannii ATCC 19606 = CIP 70.34 = JCM 6841]